MFKKPSGQDNKKIDSKLRQMSTLYHYYPAAIEVEKLKQYRVTLDISADTHLPAIIHIPKQYPDERPMVVIEASIRHPWVVLHEDQNVVLGHPCLRSDDVWDSMMPLGKLLKDIELEFRTRRPQFGLIQRSDYPKYVTPDLSDLSRERLESLVYGNDEEFIAFFEQLDFMQKFKQIQADITESIKKSAAENIESAEKLQQLQAVVAKKEVELSESVTQFDISLQLQEGFLQKHGKEAIRGQLETLLRKDELTSEDVLQRFLDGSMDLEQFCQTYEEIRTCYHLRAIKNEQLNSHPIFANTNI